MEGEVKGRWEDIDKLLSREGPFQHETFEKDTPEDPQNKEFLLKDSQILVIGAGGLGCELLKNLTLMGFRNIDVIDMDEIDVSNLNRQFLFRAADVGKPKAEVAAAFINKRVKGANVVGHYAKIQDKELEFYEQFNLIISGLDSVSARRWINSLLINMLDYDEDGNLDPDTVIPLVDGGTEGFKGQARVILPGISACFECSLDTFPPRVGFPMCTIANTPRQPEHCIQYALVKSWPEERAGEKLDKDNIDHINWLTAKAKERAAAFGIEGVTYRLTQGVAKNIIPAIASTNAIIAAATALEAFKIATNSSKFLENWMTYNGLEGLYTYTFKYEKKSSCPVCGSQSSSYAADPKQTLQDLIDDLREHPNFQLGDPTLKLEGKEGKLLWIPKPPSLSKTTKPNLEKPLDELFKDRSFLNITDPNLHSIAISLKVNFTKPPGSVAANKPE